MLNYYNNWMTFVLLYFFLFLFFLFLFVFFFVFLFLKNTDWLSLSERCDNSCNVILSFANLFEDSLRVHVLINHLTIFGCRQWSHLTFNQSSKILILGFVPLFLFKNFDYSTQQGNIRLWDRPHAPLNDGNGLLHFSIWPSETFLI